MGNKECNNFGPDSESEPISEYWEWCRFYGTVGRLWCNSDYCTHLQAEQGSDHTSLHHVVSMLHNWCKDGLTCQCLHSAPATRQSPTQLHVLFYLSTLIWVDHVLNPTVAGLQHRTDCTWQNANWIVCPWRVNNPTLIQLSTMVLRSRFDSTWQSYLNQTYRSWGRMYNTAVTATSKLKSIYDGVVFTSVCMTPS